jgi:phosphatidylserine decarboxylase
MIALTSSGLGLWLLGLAAYLRADPAPAPSDADAFVLQAYSMLPWRALSRAAGYVHDLPIPLWARVPLLSLYSKVLGVNLEEAWPARLDMYESVGALFARRLRPDARPVDPHSPLVSPVDGMVLSCGPVASTVDARGTPFPTVTVKGVAYGLGALLGGGSAHRERPLHQMTIYLSPGDYHGFHSPADALYAHSRHVSGLLLSVRPSLLGRWPVLASNERVALTGVWERGYFALVAVGATGVGSIELELDPEMRTNLPTALAGSVAKSELLAHGGARRTNLPSALAGADGVRRTTTAAGKGHGGSAHDGRESGVAHAGAGAGDAGAGHGAGDVGAGAGAAGAALSVAHPADDPAAQQQQQPSLGGVVVKRGQRLGGFRLGSCVVVLFESSERVRYAVEPGQRVRIGEALVSASAPASPTPSATASAAAGSDTSEGSSSSSEEA